MNSRKKIHIALFSALVLLMAVTLTGCFGDEDGGGEKIRLSGR
jgi:predicted small secreted protein